MTNGKIHVMIYFRKPFQAFFFSCLTYFFVCMTDIYWISKISDSNEDSNSQLSHRSKLAALVTLFLIETLIKTSTLRNRTTLSSSFIKSRAYLGRIRGILDDTYWYRLNRTVVKITSKIDFLFCEKRAYFSRARRLTRILFDKCCGLSSFTPTTILFFFLRRKVCRCTPPPNRQIKHAARYTCTRDLFRRAVA